MELLIDRQTRDALHDACRSEIEGCSDIRIDTPYGAKNARELRRRLVFLAPLLDQIGWEGDADGQVFEVNLNVRRARPFLRRNVREMQAVLGDMVTTESQFDEEIAYYERHTGESTSDEERARGLAAMRDRVDADLDMLAAYRRLLDVLNAQGAVAEAVA